MNKEEKIKHKTQIHIKVNKILDSGWVDWILFEDFLDKQICVIERDKEIFKELNQMSKNKKRR